MQEFDTFLSARGYTKVQFFALSKEQQEYLRDAWALESGTQRRRLHRSDDEDHGRRQVQAGGSWILVILLVAIVCAGFLFMMNRESSVQAEPRTASSTTSTAR